MATAVTVPAAKQAIIDDILTALDDNSLYDVLLIASDKIEVEANRFLLAARSPVLKRMLYGSFREARSSSVCLLGYDSKILSAVVEYCASDEIESFASTVGDDEVGMRRLVDLASAADYLELEGLKRKMDRLLRAKMTSKVPLACVVLDAAPASSPLAKAALNLIEGRPYAALDAGDCHEGGVECLKGEALLTIVGSKSLAAGEHFLFRMIARWFDTNSVNDHDAALEVAYRATKLLRLENIEPQVLLDEVQSRSFVSSDWIFSAVAKQAVRASQTRRWSMQCRGRAAVDRVLVENAGVADANGVYYRVAGHANGSIYSKREVAHGQSLVYTLTASVKDGRYDCRLFCTHLLTFRAVKEIVAIGEASETVAYPAFQPLLQLISLQTTPAEAGFCLGTVSDGQQIMVSAMRASLVNELELQEHAVIKVLRFKPLRHDDPSNGSIGLLIEKASVVSANPGQQFGRPKLYDAAPKEEPVDADDGLQALYQCGSTVNNNYTDMPVPDQGWETDDHGKMPAPKCTWIPTEAGDSGSESSSRASL